jgi:hypothetical protein
MTCCTPIIFQRAKLSTYLCWCWQMKEIFKEKRRAAEGPKEGHFLARQCPGSPGNWNTQKNGPPGLPISWSPTLFSRSGPVGLPTIPCTKKANEISPFFFRLVSHSCHG